MSPAPCSSTESTPDRSVGSESPPVRASRQHSSHLRSTEPRSSGPPSTDPCSERPGSTRRAFLATAGTAIASALAGCNTSGLGSAPEPLHDGDWHSYGNGPANANRVGGGAPPLEEYDVLTGAPWTYVPPVVSDGVVFAATGHRVVATRVDGTERWTRDLGAEVCGSLAIDRDRSRLYVPTQVVSTTDGPDPAPASVTTVSLDDGRILQRIRVGEGRVYGVTVDDGDVYVRSATACVRLAPDGTERWRQTLDPLVYDRYRLGDTTATQIPPAVTLDGVYLPDRDALVKLDPSSGEERWRVAVDTPYAATVVEEGRGVVQTGWRETVAVTPAGKVRWRRNLHSRAAAATTDEATYVIDSDLHELDPSTGETTWQAHVPSEGTAAPVVTDQSVLVACGDVRAFRRDDGGLLAPKRERWRLSSVHAADYATPVVASGRVFVVGPMGLLALRPGSEE